MTTTKIVSKKTVDKTKETQKQLKGENLKLKAVVFHLLKMHRVAPEGVRLGKTPNEIDEMTLQTIDYILKDDCEKMVKDYSHASLRKTIKKINRS